MKRKLLSKVLPILLAAMLVQTLASCGVTGGGQTADPSQKSQAAPAASGSNLDYLNETGLPIVNEPITLKCFISRFAQQVEYDNMLVWQEMEARTGIKIIWDTPTQEVQQRRNVLLASGDYPDMFLRSHMPATDVITYGSQGVFIEISDLINKYALNLKTYMDADPTLIKSVTAPDGNVYSMPSVSNFYDTASPQYYNSEFLNAVGMKLPVTTDEVYEVLKAFRTKDPNKNGLEDEIPWTTKTMQNLIASFQGAWGLGNRMWDGYVDINESTGALRFWPADDYYRELMEYLHRLYAENLLDQDILIEQSDAQMSAKGEQGLLGGGAAFIPVGPTTLPKLIPLEAAYKGPHGDQLMLQKPYIGSQGMFVVTDKCKYPEAAIRWADYLYSDEGTRLFIMGVEGITYEVKDGEYVFMDHITNNPDGLTYDEAQSLYIPRISGMPVADPKYLKRGGEFAAVELAGNTNMAPYSNKKEWPPLMFSNDENERLSIVKTDIDKYVGEMQVKFISGEIYEKTKRCIINFP